MFTVFTTELPIDREFRQLFELSPVGIALVDEYGVVAEANQAMCTLLGRPAAEVLEHATYEFTHSEDLASLAWSAEEVPDPTRRREIRFVHPAGEVRWACLSVTAIPGPDNKGWRLVHAQDLTQHKAAEFALAESEATLSAIASLARCVEVGADPRPVAVAAARSVARASTVALIELATDTLVITASEGMNLRGVPLPLNGTSATAHAWRTGQGWFTTDAAASPLDEPARRGLQDTDSTLLQPVIVDGTVIALLAITWQQRVSTMTDSAVRSLRELAAVTGLALTTTRVPATLAGTSGVSSPAQSTERWNWDVQVFELMEQARTSTQPLTVALVDLDHFAAFDDTFGADAGDELLRQFAIEAGARLRKGDVFAWWGGEEFILALPNCTPAEVKDLLQVIRSSVPAGCTCSIGTTTWNPDEAITETVERADSALYEAKRAGRSRTVTG